MDINERSPEIAAFLDEWKTNRAFIKGERAVKAPGATFLPFDGTMTLPAYQAMVARTPFYPGAARTFDGLKALASHKPAIVTNPASVDDILATITKQGFNIDKLAARIFAELLITNFVALVVDYPASVGPLTQAQAIERGIRPFIGMYTAENIFRIETGTVNNRQRVTRVVLKDDGDTRRELRLDDGVYTVTIWKRNGGQWSIASKVAPTKGDQTIDEIPFTLVSTDDDFEPTKAPLSDVCSINKQLFFASANLAQCHWWSCSPVPYIIKKPAEGEGEISLAPGTVWRIDCLPSEAAVGFLEWTGAQIGELRNEVDALKADLAKNGLRMLGEDKAGVEAAETAAIRRASENAITENLVRERDAGLNDALAWFAWWLDLEEGSITYEGSTDFDALPLDTPALQFLKSLKDGGDISRDALLDILIANKVLPANFDREADAQKIAEELADRPPAIVMPTTFGANDNTGAEDEPTS